MAKQTLTVGKTYKITATPEAGHSCNSITIDNEQPADFKVESGIGTCTFTMAKNVTEIEANFN